MMTFEAYRTLRGIPKLASVLCILFLSIALPSRARLYAQKMTETDSLAELGIGLYHYRVQFTTSSSASAPLSTFAVEPWRPGQPRPYTFAIAEVGFAQIADQCCSLDGELVHAKQDFAKTIQAR
eukprot:TRINITY_DN11492_c5_g3_i1.p2 TRINITY_DN11492_c5_g3~~TRINITY_DN11492_c5_g3_i1.p2  ORF type:complete len:124 (+),score=3.18 TRINITY_DN11492_c5_g3_i1:260-631(+)